MLDIFPQCHAKLPALWKHVFTSATARRFCVRLVLGIPLARFRMQPEQSMHTTIQRVVDSFDLLLSMADSPSSSALPAAAPGDSDPPTDATTAEAAALAAAIAAAAATTTVSGYDTARDYYAFKGETAKLLDHIGTVLNGIQ